jgi:precorrin-6Y C5,15-methyltransferase (decarboxylating)
MSKDSQSKKRKPPIGDKRLSVIGIGLGPEDLTAKHLSIIAQAEVLVGGRRLLAHFADSRAEKMVIGRDLDGVIAFIARRLGRRAIVVLASGDPLFHGIGTRLAEAFGPERVVIYPNVSSVAAACARIREPWESLPVVSFHGRKNEAEVFRVLDAAERAAVLTDPVHNPAWLARELQRRGPGRFRLCVLECLGGSDERFAWYDAQEAEALTFRDPNLVILKRPPAPDIGRQPLTLGTPEESFVHSRGLITKSEIRAVALAKLRLLPGQTLWDLGAGSGSVALEATLLVKKGRVVAVEKDPERAAQIRANAERFGVRSLEVVQADLPAGLAGLPQPDRIFIGGGGRDLGRIIAAAVRRLKPGGIVVVNAVLLSNLTTALESFRKSGFGAEVVQVLIQRGREMPGGERLEALNPVWIVSGIRSSEGGRRKAE